jgi:hypothetical protein
MLKRKVHFFSDNADFLDIRDGIRSSLVSNVSDILNTMKMKSAQSDEELFAYVESLAGVFRNQNSDTLADALISANRFASGATNTEWYGELLTVLGSLLTTPDSKLDENDTSKIKNIITFLQQALDEANNP